MGQFYYQNSAALAGQLIILVSSAGSESVSSLEFAWIRRLDFRHIGRLRGSNLGANFNIKILPLLQVSSSYEYLLLKVPKCEIFNRSDCFDFYTIKSPRWGDFGATIINKKNIYGFICRFEFG